MATMVRNEKMKFLLNGKEEELSETMTIIDFIEARGWEPDKVVVEINLHIIGKDAWTDIVLKENDQVEMLRFVGGGRTHE